MDDALQDVAPAYTSASYPFDLDSADIILRTPDRVDFCVHRAILSIVSPVFATMFQLPQPEDSLRGAAQASSLPVVEVSEDSKTLDTLLRLCYPVAKDEDEDIDGILSALEAAMKYDMEWPILVLNKRLEDVVSKDPLRTWAIACRLRSEKVARIAANHLLRTAKELETEHGVQTIVEARGLAVLDDISAGDYFRLCEFLRQQGAVAPDHRMLSTATASVGTPGGIHDPPDEGLFSSPIPHPDVICRSSDDVDFEAHRAILSLRSVTFQYDLPLTSLPGLETLIPPESSYEATRMLQPGTGDPSPQAPRPILRFKCNAQTLSTILAICYAETPSDLPRLAQAIAACDEHEMTVVKARAQRLWGKQALLSPLDAYFVATQYNLAAQARAAAKLALWPLGFGTQGMYTPWMENAPARAYHRLLAYLLSCRRAVEGVMAEHQTMNSWHLRGENLLDEHKILLETRRVSGCMDHMPKQSWFADYLRNFTRGSSERGGGGGWESYVGPLALLREAISENALCSRGNSFVGQLIRIGDALPQKLAAAIEEVQLGE